MEIFVIEPRPRMEVGDCSDCEADSFLDNRKALCVISLSKVERPCFRELLSFHLLCNEPLGLDVIIAVRVKPGRND